MRTHTSAGRSTTAKLVLLVLAMTATAAQLLTFRQARIRAASDLTAAVQRRAQLDRTTLTLRLEIAKRTTPQHIAQLLRNQANQPLTHIPMEWAPPSLLPLFDSSHNPQEALP